MPLVHLMKGFSCQLDQIRVGMHIVLQMVAFQYKHFSEMTYYCVNEQHPILGLEKCGV